MRLRLSLTSTTTLSHLVVVVFLSSFYCLSSYSALLLNHLPTTSHDPVRHS